MYLNSDLPVCSKVLTIIVFVLFSLFLSSLLVVPDLAKVFAVLLLVLGLVEGGRGIYAGVRHQLGLSERCLFLAFASFTVVSIISFIYWPYSKAAHYHFEDYLVFLLVLPLFLLMRYVKLNLAHLIVVFSVVAFGLGLLSFFQYWYMKTQGGYVFTFGNSMAQSWLRPSGGVNPMRYAAISLIFMGFAINAAVFVRNKSISLKCLLALAVVGSAVACMLTQVRGAWLALIAMLAVYILVLVYMGHKKLLLGFLVVCVVCVGVFSQQSQVQQRLDRTEQSFQRYLDGDSHTSLGARLDMFKAAWILIQERPIFGHGLSSYSDKATEIRLATPGMNREVGMWNNPHNEILQVMVEKGVIGLTTFIAIFASC
ncbi:MAG: O-antigen ligase family protein, partial [Bermanella sp.]